MLWQTLIGSSGNQVNGSKQESAIGNKCCTIATTMYIGTIKTLDVLCLQGCSDGF